MWRADIYLVTGPRLGMKGNEARPPPRAMPANHHDGTFPMSRESGSGNESGDLARWSGDYDQGRWPDITFPTSARNRLYHNNTRPRPAVAEKAGCCWAGGRRGNLGRTTIMAVGLGLFVPAMSSLIRSQELRVRGEFPRGYGQVSRHQGHVRSPRLPGESDHCFTNNGDGTFTVSA